MSPVVQEVQQMRAEQFFMEINWESVLRINLQVALPPY